MTDITVEDEKEKPKKRRVAKKLTKKDFEELKNFKEGKKDKNGKCAHGRPAIYTDELAEYVCMKVATNDCGIERIINLYPKMPSKETIYRWRYNDARFRVKYAAAKAAQADLLAEQILTISDDQRDDIKISGDGTEVINSEFVQRSRLRVDTRKWLAGKLMPKLYGDSKQLESLTSENDYLKKELQELRDKLAAKHEKEY